MRWKQLTGAGIGALIGGFGGLGCKIMDTAGIFLMGFEKGYGSSFEGCLFWWPPKVCDGGRVVVDVLNMPRNGKTYHQRRKAR